MRESRLFQIVYYLLAKGQTTAPELAERFEVSTRTIYRDLDALSAAGIPIYAMQGKGGGVGLLEGYTMEKALISQEERQRLLTALKCLPEGEKKAGQALEEKLRALFQGKSTDWLEVELSPWGWQAGDRAKFETLKNSILQRRILTFLYRGADGGQSVRHVCPARLTYKGSAWYLRAFCLDRKAYRTFRLTRISRETLMDESFGQLPELPPVDYAGTPSVIPPVKLRFPPSLAYRVYDEFDPGAIEVQPDGCLVVEALMPEDGWLYGYLLSFEGRVEVVSPAHVRKIMVEKIKNMASLYIT